MAVTSTARVVTDTDPRVAAFLDAYGDAFGRLVRAGWKACFDPRNPAPSTVAAAEVVLRAQGWSRREVRSALMRAGAAQEAAVASRELRLSQLRDAIGQTEWRLDRARTARARVRGGNRKPAVVKRAGEVAGRARRLDVLHARLAQVLATPAVPLWGSRRLWRAQYDLAANDYPDHDAWLAEWRAARSNVIYLQGDRDKPAGNTEARIALDDNGGAVITVTVPDCLRPIVDGAASIEIPVRGFAHHRAHLAAAQEPDKDRHTEQVRRYDAGESPGRGRPASKTRPVLTGRGPVTVSFTRNPDGIWYAAATVARHAAPKPATTKARNAAGHRTGAVGVDINPDHLAWSLINPDGNPIRWGRIPLALANPDGNPVNSDRAAAVIGDAVKALVAVAIKAGHVPLVSEELDFTRAHQRLRYLPHRTRRVLSSFAYNAIGTAIHGRCTEHGIEHITINPAYTSVLGQTNYAATYGVSVDQAAACIIARRGLGLTNAVRTKVIAGIGPEDPKPGTTVTPVTRENAHVILAKRLPQRRSTWGTLWLTRHRVPAPQAPTSEHATTRPRSGQRAPQRPAARPRPVPRQRTRTGAPTTNTGTSGW